MRRKINWILGGLIALVSGCKPTQQAIQQGVVTLYGVPYATYNISGQVLNNDGKPIKKTSIVIKDSHKQLIGDTLITDKKGEFSISTSAFPTEEINIIVVDPITQQPIDSVQHTATYQIDEEKRGFYRGECKIETTITLKDKKQ